MKPLRALAWGALIGAAFSAGAATAQPRRAPAAGDAGMVVTGDREAPQVLTIVPWLEPATVEPAPLPGSIGLPPVLDDERPLPEEPLSKPLSTNSPARSK